MSFCAFPRAKSWLQTLKFHSPISPDPLNACSLRSLGFPKSPPLKSPRSANGVTFEMHRIVDALYFAVYCFSVNTLTSWWCSVSYCCTMYVKTQKLQDLQEKDCLYRLRAFSSRVLFEKCLSLSGKKSLLNYLQFT